MEAGPLRNTGRDGTARAADGSGSAIGYLYWQPSPGEYDEAGCTAGSQVRYTTVSRLVGTSQ